MHNRKLKKKIYRNPYTEDDGHNLNLRYLSFLFWGSFGNADGRDDVHRNARRRRRIRPGSNSTSVMN